MDNQFIVNIWMNYWLKQFLKEIITFLQIEICCVVDTFIEHLLRDMARDDLYFKDEIWHL